LTLKKHKEKIREEGRVPPGIERGFCPLQNPIRGDDYSERGEKKNLMGKETAPGGRRGEMLAQGA